MIPEIIEQMRKELYDTKLCISDFEKYDLKTLEKINEPFFWLVRDFLDNIFGTHVILCADIRFYLVQHLHRSVT